MMKNYIKSLLLTLLVTFVSVSASAYDFEVDGVYYSVISTYDKTCGVAAGDTQYSGDIVVPQTVTFKGKTLTVSEICEKAFYKCSDLTSIKLPSIMSKIGGSAFYLCNSLKSIVVPDGVTRIDGEAFAGCSSLKEAKLPNSLQMIGESAFEGCTNLLTIAISDSVTSIGKYAFMNCENLQSVRLSSGITRIEKWTFCQCYNLKSIEIPEGITDIGEGTFENSGLETITFPSSVQYIEKYAFEYSKLKSVYFGNGDAGTKVYLCAFRGCENLSTVSLGRYTNLSGNHIFDNCPNLDTVIIRNPHSFYYMTKYNYMFSTLIIAEDYRTDLGLYGGQAYNENLKRIVCKLDNPVTWKEEVNPFTNDQYINVELIVPTNSLATYQTTHVWKSFWDIKGGAENYDLSTGICTPTVDRGNKPDAIYDLNGRRLTSPKKGLNIINGKKVFVK